MVFAEWAASFREEALSLEVLLATGAIEALTVVVIVQGLHPFVAGFDGESAGEALGGEQFVPVGFAIGIAFLQEERAISEQLSAVCTLEALRVELLADGVQAVTLDSGVALAAQGGQELLEAVLAIQIALLLDESDVGQRTLAVGVVADEVIRAPDAAKSGDERTCDNLVVAFVANGYLVHQRRQHSGTIGAGSGRRDAILRHFHAGRIVMTVAVVVIFLHIGTSITRMRG